MDVDVPTQRPLRLGAWVGLIWVAGLLACGDSATDEGVGPMSPVEACEPEATEVIETQRLTYRSFGRDFEGVCSGSFEAAEAHASWIEQVWGRPQVGDEFWLYASREEACWPCGENAGACAVEDIAHAITLPHRHELSHSVRQDCPTLIEEGFASIYGNYFFYHLTVDDLAAAIEASDEVPLHGMYYGIGGAFVAFLISRDGMASLHQLCDLDIPRTLSLAQGLEEVYQLPLNELIAEFEATPRKGNAYLKQELACDALAGGADLEVIASPGSWVMDLGCGAPGVEGGVGQYTMAQRLVEILEDGAYRFEMIGSADYTIQLEARHCEREAMASISYEHEFALLIPGEPRAVIFDLLAGTYVLRARTWKDENGDNGPGPGELTVEFSVDSWP